MGPPQHSTKQNRRTPQYSNSAGDSYHNAIEKQEHLKRYFLEKTIKNTLVFGFSTGMIFHVANWESGGRDHSSVL